jgi:glycosyltransferase involved in cell wall biosynthesis
VRLRGAKPRAEVAALLREADVVVAPSIWTARGDREGIPVALMEAMASGVAVVASALSGIPELVTDGVDGLLVPPGDAAALADALQRLAVDESLRERLSAAGRERVLRDFDVRANTAALAREFLGERAA